MNPLSFAFSVAFKTGIILAFSPASSTGVNPKLRTGMFDIELLLFERLRQMYRSFTLNASTLPMENRFLFASSCPDNYRQYQVSHTSLFRSSRH